MPKTAIAVLLTASVATFAPLEARAPQTVKWRQKAAERMLTELTAISGVPGLGAAVWSNGKVIWHGSAGYRDLDRMLPVTNKTVFRLASVSKLLAVTAAAKLADEGKLDLDAPVASTLPWLKNAWPAITPRQLAAHTAGLPHYQAQDATRGSQHFASDRDAVGIFSERALLAPPGQAYSYSSWGYTLIGALVEQAGGMTFPDYVTTKLTPGLAIMRDPTDSGHPDAATAYEWTDTGLRRAPPHDFSYTWAGGGMAASPDGIVRFGGAMLEDRIVSKASFDRLLVPIVLNDGKPAGERDFSVGFGWRNGTDSQGKPIAFHNGVTLGARSALVLWREEQLGASLLSNLQWVSSIEQSAAMLAAPFRAQPVLESASCPIKVRRFSGTLGESRVSGTASFALEAGLCIGTLSLEDEFKSYFKAANQSKRDRLRIVGIGASGGIGRAGLVTPFGIYDLRMQPDGSLASRFSATRELRLSLLP